MIKFFLLLVLLFLLWEQARNKQILYSGTKWNFWVLEDGHLLLFYVFELCDN